MAESSVFYGTMSLRSDALDDKAFVAIWDKALDAFNDTVSSGITGVGEGQTQDGAVIYDIKGKTDSSFDENVDFMLSGSLVGQDTDALYKALEELGLTVGFAINEYQTSDDIDDSLTYETAGIAIKDGKAQLVDPTYRDLQITSRRLVDMGFEDESTYDDEELAVMVSAEFPDGPSADELIDAIETLREDDAHDGVFTASETADIFQFGEELIGSADADNDID